MADALVSVRQYWGYSAIGGLEEAEGEGSAKLDSVRRKLDSGRPAVESVPLSLDMVRPYFHSVRTSLDFVNQI